MKDWIVESEHTDPRNGSKFWIPAPMGLVTFEIGYDILLDCYKMRIDMRVRNVKTGDIFPKEWIL